MITKTSVSQCTLKFRRHDSVDDSLRYMILILKLRADFRKVPSRHNMISIRVYWKSCRITDDVMTRISTDPILEGNEVKCCRLQF